MNEILTEKELLRHFEHYRKLLSELVSLYKMVSIKPMLSDDEEPEYVREASFSYEVHASH